ncbi:MAG TPA: transglutaminaseTgpA domain-containing protein [Actinomycetota bacterium]
MSGTTDRAGVVRPRRPKEPPEDSIPLRAIVGALVMVALVAVVAQRATDAFTSVGGLLLVPAGYVFSYVQRRKANVATKVVLAVGLLAALGSFLQGVRFAETVDEARIPLASLFVWVQVLHSFDVPRRRDLAFSVVSSLILMAEAGALSFGTGFLVFLVPWTALAGAWLYLSQRPATHEVAEPAFVRRFRERGGAAPAFGRSLVAATAATLTAVSAVFLVLPRLPGAFVRLPPFAVRNAVAVEGFAGQVLNPGLPASAGPGGPVVDFAPTAYPGFGSTVDLRARGRLSDRIVMRVRTPQAALWRGQVYDTFDGTAWTASDTQTQTIGQDSIDQSFAIPAPAEGFGAPTRRIVTTFYVAGREPNIVFSAFAPEQVFFPTANLSIDAYGSLRSPIYLEDGMVYSVVSQVPVTTPAILRGAIGTYDAAAVRRYTQLPNDLPERDVALADRITGGAVTTYDKVMAVQRWLQRNTTYNLDVPRQPPGVDAVDWFLFDEREGFCEHIASAMAVLLRAEGIPTRLVTGFGPGERNPFTGYYEVREADAHAWVEVLYPGIGWVPYDPTFGVPPADPGLGGRFIAPEVIRAVGRFLASITPEPVRAAGRAAGRAIATAAQGVLAAWPVAVAGLGGLIAIGVLARRRKRVRGQGPSPTGAAAAFVTLSRALAEEGRARRDHETPEEFLTGVRREGILVQEAVPDAEAVVRAFEWERFSGVDLPPEQAADALAAAARVHERLARPS